MEFNFLLAVIGFPVLWVLWNRVTRLTGEVQRLREHDLARASEIQRLSALLPRSPAPDPEPLRPHPETQVSEPLVALPPPPAADHVRPNATAQRALDWEAAIGQNWLNRLGVLVLVIGLALFLAYSLNSFKAAGKVSLGFAFGATLLFGGILLERRLAQRNFARGLMGGGWAAIYFTTYALHALPAARLVDDPTVGAALLLAVSLVIAAHSLVFRSETVTSVALFVTFATLTLSPRTTFSNFAALAIAVVALLTAHRRGWYRLALIGVVGTYWTFLLGDAEPRLLWVFWLTFEAFDLLALRARKERRFADEPVFLANATGWLVAGLEMQDMLWEKPAAAFYLQGVLAYSLSAVLRALPVSPAQHLAASVRRMVRGSFEGAAVVAALLTQAACAAFYSGVTASFYCLLVAEVLLLAAAIRNLPALAVSAFLLSLAPLGLLLGFNETGPAQTAALLAASFFFAVKYAAAPRLGVAGTSSAAALCAAISALCVTRVLFLRLDGRLLTIALGLEAAAILAAGFWRHDRMLRVLGLLLFSLCLTRLFLLDLQQLDPPSRIVSFLVLGVLLLAASWVYTRGKRNGGPPQ